MLRHAVSFSTSTAPRDVVATGAIPSVLRSFRCQVPSTTTLPAVSLFVARRSFTWKSVESQLPPHIKLNPNDPAARTPDDHLEGKTPSSTTREGETAGISGVYGRRAETVMRGMIGPQGHADARESKALPILGKATPGGTAYTVSRSTVFERWHHRCADPVGWSLSKLASATCKMGKDPSEAVESLQLQIIKGMNTFEIDGSATEHHQSFARALHDTLEAFELDRDGFVILMRCGVIKQPQFQDEITKIEASNTAVLRSRIMPIVERFKASSLPAAQLKAGFRFTELTDVQLAQMNLRRESFQTCVGLSPDWLEAYLTNVAFNTRLECVDVVLLEGLHVFFDGRTDAHIDDDILQMFAFLEHQVKLGHIQYYGISSLHLAPPVNRTYPAMPPDALVPDMFREPPTVSPTINLYRLLAIAERAAGGSSHHLRFVEYPFNLTNHQALSTPLPYDSNHTLLTLCHSLGITAIGYSPLQATNLMSLPERYHSFPMENDLKATRMNFVALCERCVMKEMEVKEDLERGPPSLPKMEDLFVASVYLSAQRQFTNLFFFRNWATHYMMPRFRSAVMRLKEASSNDMKEWCKQYEQLIDDLLRLRRRMFEHKHGVTAAQINMSVDHLSPTLSQCPMLNQKAINFATHGCDALLCGFHVSRFFHEATELNPARNGELVVPPSELDALCQAESVSYANASPPHPYMLDPPLMQGKLSKQKSKALENAIPIDLENPKFPDIPEEVDASGSSADSSECQAGEEHVTAHEGKTAVTI